MNATTTETIRALRLLLQDWAEASATWDDAEVVSEGGDLIAYLRDKAVAVPAGARRRAVRDMLRGMSLREAARELDMSPSRVSQIRDGK